LSVSSEKKSEYLQFGHINPALYAMLVVFIIDNQKDTISSRFVQRQSGEVYATFPAMIRAVKRSHILFGQVEIPVSDAYKDFFQAFLNENFL
jgi:hypothetical protein